MKIINITSTVIAIILAIVVTIFFLLNQWIISEFADILVDTQHQVKTLQKRVEYHEKLLSRMKLLNDTIYLEDGIYTQEKLKQLMRDK